MTTNPINWTGGECTGLSFVRFAALRHISANAEVSQAAEKVRYETIDG